MPDIGDIYYVPCSPKSLGWGWHHLLVLQFFQTVAYRDETCACRCIVLETGEQYEMYRDELGKHGRKVA